MKLDTMPHAGAATRLAGGAVAATTIANRGGTSGFTRVRRAAAGLVLAALAAAAPARAADVVVLYNFTTNATGAMNLNHPGAGLTIDASGNLYGSAYYNGGASSSGGVFRLARQADGSYATPTALANFASTGPGPRGPLYDPVTLDAQGNVYGAAYFGGANDVGAVYQIAAGTGTVTTLASFDGNTTAGSTGLYTRGAVVRTTDGTLWGTTATGGGGNGGVVYKVTPGATDATLVATFGQNGLSGSHAYSGLVADAQGNLYGSTSAVSGNVNGAGTLFKVDTTAGTVTTLATFAGGSGGTNPNGALAVDGQGNLFGTTITGGTGYGTVFELAAGSSTITTLASFNGGTTGSSGRGVIVDAAGNLFGTTFAGGGGGGTVWSLAAGSSTLTTLASFSGSGTGPRNQYGGLVADAAGNLYGTTYYGGTSGGGTIFKLANTGYVTAAAAVPEPASWTMMIVGMGAVGGTLRRRQKVTARVSCAA